MNKWVLIGIAIVIVGVTVGLIWAKVGKTTGDYIEQTVETKDVVRKQAALIKVRKMIQMHLAMKGSYPAAIEDLDGLPRLPDGWAYDYVPETGKVDLVERK